jgi:hypothetical protein
MARLTFRCGHEKTPSNSEKRGRWFRCKRCKRAMTMRWFAKHPDWHRVARKRRRQQRIELRLQTQQGRCAICKREMLYPYEDHRHGCCTKDFGCEKCRRGLLCPSCNGGLHLVENTKLLKAAIAYLQKWA